MPLILSRSEDIYTPADASEHVLVIERALITAIIVVKLHEILQIFEIRMRFIYKLQGETKISNSDLQLIMNIYLDIGCCFCDLVVRVSGYRSEDPRSISGATRFSVK
jgi:hypothetical protein